MGRQLVCILAASFTIGSAAGQQPASEPSESVDKRVFGVLPNYCTADGSRPFQTISTKQKFTIASKDSFDWPVYLNSAAVAISNAYYPDTRTVSDNTQKLAVQLATDMFSNVLKEFWPDIKRKLA